jgi:hypothetical protein
VQKAAREPLWLGPRVERGGETEESMGRALSTMVGMCFCFEPEVLSVHGDCSDMQKTYFEQFLVEKKEKLL